MKSGDKVEILHSHYKFCNTLVGRTGTIISTYGGTYGNIAVKVDGLENPRSGYGYFYFAEKQLKKLKEDSKMSTTKIMEGNYRIASVKFVDGNNTDKTYRYACYDDRIVKGDMVVVKSAHHGFGVAQITDIEDKTEEQIIREIVCKADFSDYYIRERNRARKAELKKKMAARAAQLQEIALYAMLAKEDFDMKELLSEYEGLDNGN